MRSAISTVRFLDRHGCRSIHTLLRTSTACLNATAVISDLAFLVPQFLSVGECKSILMASERIGYSATLVNLGKSVYSPNEIMRKDIRNNDRILYDNTTLAALLYERLNTVPAFLPAPAGLSLHSLHSHFRFYRYTPGQRFKPHRDRIVSLFGGKIQSQYTMLMFLNEDMKGGETRFYHEGGAVSVRPQVGQALLFRHQLLHEGVEVTDGAKYVLRTDVLFSPPGHLLPS